MGVSEGLGKHSMLREGDLAVEEHGDLKACRQLLSIRARLRNETICRIFETPCMDRVSALTSTDPRFDGVEGSSPGIPCSLDIGDPDPETLNSSLSETKETATHVLVNEEEGHFFRPGMSRMEIAQDHHVTTFESASEGEDDARQVDDVQGCQGSKTHENYSSKLAAKKSLECAAVLLDDEDQQQECRSSSEAALGLSRRLDGAESLRRKEVMMIMERLYRDHPGAVWRRTSREAIKAAEAQGREPASAKVLIYGEISFIAFTKLLEMYAPTMAPISPRPSLDRREHSQASPASSGFTFYDLGCGAGRLVFMTSLLMTSCVKSCGVEIIPSMHQMNKELHLLYDVEVRKWLHPAKQAQNITFLCGDMLQVDWSDADIVFTNATCFDDILFGNLEARAKNILKEGAIVIVVTRRFKSDSVWELINQTERRMSWSPAVVTVYRKKTETLKLPTMVETRE